jgi:hypothetical protein
VADLEDPIAPQAAGDLLWTPLLLEQRADPRKIRRREPQIAP